jgi:hypothetical protein
MQLCHALYCILYTIAIHKTKNTKNISDPQWRNRLARGTYRQYLSYAEVVSSSLTWGRIFFILYFYSLLALACHEGLAFALLLLLLLLGAHYSEYCCLFLQPYDVCILP